MIDSTDLKIIGPDGKRLLESFRRFSGHISRDITAGEPLRFVVGWNIERGFFFEIEFPGSVSYRLLEGAMS